MNPNPSDPLFCMYMNSVQRAGIRSIPVESTWEREVLKNLDFNPHCEHTTSHLIGRDGHTGDTTAHYLLTAPCGLQVYMCETSIDTIEEHINRRSWCGNHSHANTELVFTPLPEGDR